MSSPGDSAGGDTGSVLLEIARGSLEEALLERPFTPPDVGWVYEPGATFVTLKANDALRGCVGSLAAARPLIDDVKSNALAAAFRDSRFPPLRASELATTRIELSLVSPLEEMVFDSRQEVLTLVRPGIDGLLLECDGQRGTFLPQVWESLPDPGDFLANLLRKAGLEAEFWSPAVRIWRYNRRPLERVDPVRPPTGERPGPSAARALLGFAP